MVDLHPAQGNRTVRRTLALLRRSLLSLLSEDVQQSLLTCRIHLTALWCLLLNRLLLGLSGLLRRELLSPTETTLSLRGLAPRIDRCCQILRRREALGRSRVLRLRLLELRLLNRWELLLLLDGCLELRLLNVLLLLDGCLLLLDGCLLLLVRLSLTGLLRVLVHRELRRCVLRLVQLGCLELALFEGSVGNVLDAEVAAHREALGTGSTDGVGNGLLLLACRVDRAKAVVIRHLRVTLVGLDRDDHLPLGISRLPELQFLGLDVTLLNHRGFLGDGSFVHCPEQLVASGFCSTAHEEVVD